jgi:biotin transport system substrate-specific component
MASASTIAGVLRPCNKASAGLYDIALIVGGSLLIGLSAQVAVGLPFSPVPVTGQTFAVLMAGLLLGARRGSLCVLVYLVQGIAGLPVFAAAPKAGPAVLLGPTGGYLIGFLAAAYLTGLLAERGWDRHVFTTILAMTVGNAVIYLCGLIWLSMLAGIKAAVVTGLLPFVAGDILKLALAAAILPTGWKILASFCSPLKTDKFIRRGG